MTPAEWAVVIAGVALIAFELWFFLGGRRRRGSAGSGASANPIDASRRPRRVP